METSGFQLGNNVPEGWKHLISMSTDLSQKMLFTEKSPNNLISVQAFSLPCGSVFWDNLWRFCSVICCNWDLLFVSGMAYFRISSYFLLLHDANIDTFYISSLILHYEKSEILKKMFIQMLNYWKIGKKNQGKTCFFFNADLKGKKFNKIISWCSFEKLGSSRFYNWPKTANALYGNFRTPKSWTYVKSIENIRWRQNCSLNHDLIAKSIHNYIF